MWGKLGGGQTASSPGGRESIWEQLGQATPALAVPRGVGSGLLTHLAASQGQAGAAGAVSGWGQGFNMMVLGEGVCQFLRLPRPQLPISLTVVHLYLQKGPGLQLSLRFAASVPSLPLCLPKAQI